MSPRRLLVQLAVRGVPFWNPTQLMPGASCRHCQGRMPRLRCSTESAHPAERDREGRAHLVCERHLPNAPVLSTSSECRVQLEPKLSTTFSTLSLMLVETDTAPASFLEISTSEMRSCNLAHTGA
mmetsp:Transcript_74707/g.242782  ORF Transcript_74707/g.242782 Transcript_74707/m.242782 type:complete len:125 (-) Transcript_74707:47-421(-)